MKQKNKYLFFIVVLISTLLLTLIVVGKNTPKETESIEQLISLCDQSKNKVDAFTLNKQVEECLFKETLTNQKGIASQIKYFNSLTTTSYATYCHFLNHKLAQYYLDQKIDYLTLLREPTPSCSDGFSHGVYEAITKTLDIKEPSSIPLLYDICSEKESTLANTSCVHGIGHYIYKNYQEKNINREAMYNYCKNENQNSLMLHTCAAGISMSIMFEDFDGGDPNFNNCQYNSRLEKTACYTFPNLSMSYNPAKSLTKSYCWELSDQLEKTVCEFGIVNKYVNVTPAEEMLNYCLKLSADSPSCLHHLVMQLPTTRGEKEYQATLKSLFEGKISYPVVSKEEFATGSDALLNANLEKITLITDKTK